MLSSRANVFGVIPVPPGVDPPDLEWHRSKIRVGIAASETGPCVLTAAEVDQLARLRGWAAVRFEQSGRQRPWAEQRLLIDAACEAAGVEQQEDMSSDASPSELTDDPFWEGAST